MKRKMEVSELIFKIIAYVFLIVFALLCVYPLLYVLGSTFSSSDAIADRAVVLWPLIGEKGSYHFGFNIDSFKWAVNYNMFWVSYSNTLFVTFIGTIWCLVYSILGAYALSKKRLWGRHGFNFVLVFTMWFSAGIVPQFLNYQRTGEIMATIAGHPGDMFAIDLKWLIVLAMGMNATNIILLRNAFEGVPAEIEEAARIDGATELQVLMNVYIPMSKATIATVALFFGISRWNGYFWASKVLGEGSQGQNYSWPVQVLIRNIITKETDLINIYNTDDSHDFASAAAGTSVLYAMIVLAVIPILIIYPFISKYFAKGVNMGGVKE
ncbi:MAG: carbohydrate ABC transporter permease [Clostridia bacterium]|nr:carbohydrate ABC transporter permease [Clostridia bacterium]